jgi:hypothetical protein
VHGRRDGTLSDIPFEVFLGVLHASACQSSEWWARLSAAPVAKGYTTTAKISSPSLASLHSHSAKAVLMVRILFGVDELSMENIKLHSEHDQLESIAEMELSAFQPKRDKPSAN